jgi:tetratricopeptide (TPR) repeat protein
MIATMSIRLPPLPRVCACLCILLGTGANAQHPVPGDLEAAGAAMSKGIASVHGGNLIEARRDFAEAVKLAPEIPATHAALGSVLLSQDDLTAALQELTLAHSLAPADIANNLNLARADVEARRFADAVLLFQNALVTTPPPTLSAEESLAYATALASTGNAAAAEPVLRTALETNPDSAPLNDALGTLLAQDNEIDQAVPLFEHATLADPGFNPAHFHLGVALLTLNRPDEALAPLQLAAAANPSSLEIQLQLGRTLSALHRDSEALIALHRAAELRTASTSIQALSTLALALQASGDPKSARPLFDLAIADPALTDSSALINAALSHVQTGDATGALPLYARALKLGPDSTTLREDYGAAYLQQADLNHALEQFRAGVALDPASAHLHYDLGLALKLKDNLADAIPEFQRAAQLDPTLPDPAYTLGVIYMQQGHFLESAAQLRKATALQPGNGDAWALLGSVLKESNDPAAAADALHRAIALQPDQPSLHIQLAALEVEAGQKDAAAADRKIAADLSRIAITRQRASFALKSGRALLAENKLDEAILQLHNAVAADPTLAEPHTLLAEAYNRQGKAADAASELHFATQLQLQHVAQR